MSRAYASQVLGRLNACHECGGLVAEDVYLGSLIAAGGDMDSLGAYPVKMKMMHSIVR